MKTVFNNTFKQAVRTKYLQVLSVILLLLFILVAFNSVIAYKAGLQSFEKARETVRTAWLNHVLAPYKLDRFSKLFCY
jgi:hypothetical protein